MKKFSKILEESKRVDEGQDTKISIEEIIDTYGNLVTNKIGYGVYEYNKKGIFIMCGMNPNKFNKNSYKLKELIEHYITIEIREDMNIILMDMNFKNAK